MPRFCWTFKCICSFFVLMRNFGAKHRGVTHFGLWADESADLFGQHDAWSIIAAAVKRTMDEDIRCHDVEDALSYLERFSLRERPFRDFCEALGIANPHERFAALRDAMGRIGRALSG